MPVIRIEFIIRSCAVFVFMAGWRPLSLLIYSIS
jgi:hypothetical protein